MNNQTTILLIHLNHISHHLIIFSSAQNFSSQSSVLFKTNNKFIQKHIKRPTVKLNFAITSIFYTSTITCSTAILLLCTSMKILYSHNPYIHTKSSTIISNKSIIQPFLLAAARSHTIIL